MIRIEQEVLTEIGERLFSGKKKYRNLNLLRSLLEDKGWAVICEILDIRVERLSDKVLLVKDDYSEDAKDRELLEMFKFVRELPRQLLKEFGDEDLEENSMPDHDPYAKPDLTTE